VDYNAVADNTGMCAFV